MDEKFDPIPLAPFPDLGEMSRELGMPSLGTSVVQQDGRIPELGAKSFETAQGGIFIQGQLRPGDLLLKADGSVSLIGPEEGQGWRAISWNAPPLGETGREFHPEDRIDFGRSAAEFEHIVRFRNGESQLAHLSPRTVKILNQLLNLSERQIHNIGITRGPEYRLGECSLEMRLHEGRIAILNMEPGDPSANPDLHQAAKLFNLIQAGKAEAEAS